MKMHRTCFAFKQIEIAKSPQEKNYQAREPLEEPANREPALLPAQPRVVFFQGLAKKSRSAELKEDVILLLVIFLFHTSITDYLIEHGLAFLC
jgi:hypothetical protein